jgi:hypothetical protein
VDGEGRVINRYDVCVVGSYGRETIGSANYDYLGISEWIASGVSTCVILQSNDLNTSIVGYDLKGGIKKKLNNFQRCKIVKFPIESLSPRELREYKKIVKEHVNTSSRKPISFGW